MAIFAFVDISVDGYYIALKASNVWHLTSNDQLKYHKINNLSNIINDNISKNANLAA